MNRVEAQALALVNWNGMVYERFWLDRERRVTALAGDNGAGKTTIMIGAYVVLMPDMVRLRFTNLGASATTSGDRGIWGRLGEQGGPSYAALDFDVPGEGRLVAVVRLERKGEPSVELTPMTIEGLGPSTLLKDLFLSADGDTEYVVDQQGLRENTTRAGGTLRVHDSTGKYFATLYEKGVMPLRMATDEDRNRFNEMLRTSMQGGMSSRILQDLGKFLLMEETRLGDSLLRMRENLDSCRHTRGEVQESQHLEREISEIYDLGNAMFAAAYLMTNKRAEEYEQRLRGAESEAEAARTALVGADARFAKAENRLAAYVEEAKQIKDDLGKASMLVSSLETGIAITLKLATLAEEEKREREERDHAATAFASARVAEAQSVERVHRSRDALNRAVQGLADFQIGLDELQRKAALHRQATEKLAIARDCLDPGLSPESLNGHLSRACAERDRLDGTRREKERIYADVERHAQDFATAVRALEEISGNCPLDCPSYDEAQEALRGHRERVEFVATLPVLEADRRNARNLANKQKEIRSLATSLGIEPVSGQSPATIVRGRQEEILTSLEALHEARLAEEQAAIALNSRGASLSKDREVIEAKEPRWRELMRVAERIARFTGTQLASEDDLDGARSLIKAAHEVAVVERNGVAERHEAYVAEARLLAQAGGPFSTELLRVREDLGAELYANRFENLPLAEAALTEALLGERAMALVVPDPLAAVSLLSTRDAEALPNVYLIAENDEAEPAGNYIQCTTIHDVAEWVGSVLRVSRIPERPRLGRRARAARIEELRRLAAEENSRLDNAGARVFNLARLSDDAETLLKGMADWLGPLPDDELNRIEREMEETRLATCTALDRGRRLAEDIARLKKEAALLSTLLENARLLESPDYDERANEIEAILKRAYDADARVKEEERACLELERFKDDLRFPPIGNNGLKDLENEISNLRSRRTRLDAGIEALQALDGNIEALGWKGYEKALQEKQEIRPELERQREQAMAELEVAEFQHSDASEQRREAERADLEARGRLSRIISAIAEEQVCLERLEIGEPSQERLEAAQRLVREAESRINELGTLSGQEHQEIGAAGQEVKMERMRVEVAEASLAKEQGEAGPARQRRDELESRTLAAGYDSGLFLGSAEELNGIGGSINLGQEAERFLTRLQERARMARQEADALIAMLSRRPREREGESFGMSCFSIWTEVRGWIVKRLPLEISEGDDPREMLSLLKQRLATVEAQLLRQEKLLRGTGEDIANGIKVRIRKERSKTDRLNRELEGIRFGGISGIRIRTVPVEEMALILSGLEAGSLQNALFGEEIPFEEALDRVFEEYGGGKGNAGGHKVLDYREYIHLQVEFRRIEKDQWEIADTGKLSTGEAIGVGAALMMVILGAWEGDEVLFRGKRQYGSLRFLFLDEANRLDPRSLGVLFDLCGAIGLQLIVAAPEVALSEGNITHQIVPTYLEDGHRKVQVFSRRQVQQAN